MENLRQILISATELLKVIVISAALTMLDIAQRLLPNIFAPRKSLAGRLVVVTGSGSGLGRLLALKLGKINVRLALVDQNQASNDETAELVRTMTGAEAVAFTGDLSKRKELYRVMDAIQAQMGDVDVLINNASHYFSKPFLDTPDEDINMSENINYLAHCWALHAFLPKMVERNQGHIVTIASAAGLIGTSQLTAYSASKHAAVGFHRALDMELDEIGATEVKTTLVCPYYIKSERTEGLKTKFNWLLPIVGPEEAVEKILEAVQRDRKFLGIPCAINAFFVLQNILPVTVAHYIARSFGFIHSTSGSTNSMAKSGSNSPNSH